MLAAGVDTGGLRVSRSEVEKFATERGYLVAGNEREGATWAARNSSRPSSPALSGTRFPASQRALQAAEGGDRGLKDEGRLLMRFNELREMCNAVVRRVQAVRGPGTARGADAAGRSRRGVGAGVRELGVLQPERINAYAQAVIRTLQTDEHQRGLRDGGTGP